MAPPTQAYVAQVSAAQYQIVPVAVSGNGLIVNQQNDMV